MQRHTITHSHSKADAKLIHNSDAMQCHMKEKQANDNNKQKDAGRITIRWSLTIGTQAIAKGRVQQWTRQAFSRNAESKAMRTQASITGKPQQMNAGVEH